LRNSRRFAATKTRHCARAFSNARRNFSGKNHAASVFHNAVKLIECPRDAWQGLKRQIPAELKARYLRALIAAGFKHIDAVSFVSPKAVPQMADSEKVLEQVSPPNDVEIIGIVVNEKGAERATATEAVTTLGYPCSISETFLRKNQNQTLEDSYKTLESIKTKADASGLGMVVYISMAFGNPYGDPWDEDELRRAVQKLAALGVRSISLADTVGVADPHLIRRVVQSITNQYADYDIGVHLHSTRGEAAAKVLAAYGVGCRRIDSAVGGLGGCPFAQDALVGNIPTESVISVLQQRGIELRISKKSLANVLAMTSLIASDYQ
jgi:hydroxymethylglutaryl-CoA lyase